MSKTIFQKDLEQFCIDALNKSGMESLYAVVTAKVLVETDAYGTHSHGTKNLRLYIEKFKAGALDQKARPEFILQGGAFAVMDAKDAMGMVSSYLAMEKAVELAQKSGIGFVSVKNSCHFGAAGYYANMAAQKGLIGIAMSNTDPNMTVPGGKSMIIGNSPIAYAVPAGKYKSMFLDIAMSATAALKINQAKLEKKAIPNTWLVDDKGIPTTDPKYYGNGGALQPMAAHKGYGLSLLVDVLSGVLSGGEITSGITSWCFDMAAKNRVSHAFIALDIRQMQPEDKFIERIEGYIDYLKNAPKAKGNDTIYYPGEIEWLKKQKADEQGIALPDDVVQSLEQLAQSTGLSLAWVQ